MDWSLRLTDPPAIEPITLAEMKNHLRVDLDMYDDDTLISSQIRAAREYCEKYQGLSYITQTWILTHDAVPSYIIDLPRPPLQSVEKIEFRDEDGDLTEWAAANYFVDVDATPGRVVITKPENIPTKLYEVSAMRIEYITGNSSPDHVPETVKAAVKLLVGHMYENREAVIVGGSVPREMEFAVSSLLDIDRLMPI